MKTVQSARMIIIPLMTVTMLETAAWEDGDVGGGGAGEGPCGEAVGMTFMSGLQKGNKERLNDTKIIVTSYLVVTVGKEQERLPVSRKVLSVEKKARIGTKANVLVNLKSRENAYHTNDVVFPGRLV
jgi:hypothetical protein